MISWTWNNITLWLWIRIDVKTLRKVGLTETWVKFESRWEPASAGPEAFSALSSVSFG